MKMKCNSCGHEMIVDDDKRGKLVKCRQCKKLVLVRPNNQTATTVRPAPTTDETRNAASEMTAVAGTMEEPKPPNSSEEISTMDNEIHEEPKQPNSSEEISTMDNEIHEEPKQPNSSEEIATMDNEIHEEPEKLAETAGKESYSPKARFCTNCGRKLPENSKFCPDCGVATDENVAGGAPIAPWAPVGGVQVHAGGHALPQGGTPGVAAYRKPGDFSFSGRARRSEFFKCVIVSIIVTTILLAVDFVAVSSLAGLLDGGGFLLIFNAMVFIPLLIYSLATQVRRLHDIGWSGFCCLLPFIPFVGWIAEIVLWGVLLFMDGQPGPNRYGPDPKGRPSPYGGGGGMVSGTISFTAQS